MSTGTPEKLIPRRLDPRKLAYQGAVYTGTIPADALLRLQNAVDDLEKVSAEVEFKVAEDGEKILEGTLTADVKVVCQRCLEPFATRVGSEFVIAAVWNEDEAKQLRTAYDPWITGEGEGDVYEILEEELLLSLPVVAFHEGDCVDPELYSSGEAPEDEAEEKPNPFQVLKQLKGDVKK